MSYKRGLLQRLGEGIVRWVVRDRGSRTEEGEVCR